MYACGFPVLGQDSMNDFMLMPSLQTCCWHPGPEKAINTRSCCLGNIVAGDRLAVRAVTALTGGQQIVLLMNCERVNLILQQQSQS